ncbi:TetR family transcriptional regulator [bacterium]|nr:TetR family transcriptional regulator [bacterium]
MEDERRQQDNSQREDDTTRDGPKKEEPTGSTPSESGRNPGLERIITDMQNGSVNFVERFDEVLASMPEDLRPPEEGSPRHRILEAARVLFAEEGFENTSTRAIAERAEVNQAMIHYYFQSKDALYHRVLTTQILYFFNSVRQRVRDVEDPRDLLVRVPLTFYEVLTQNPIWKQIMRREMGSGAHGAIRAAKDLGQYGPLGMIRAMATLFERLQQHPGFPDMRFPDAWAFLFGFAYSSAFIEPLMRAVYGEMGIHWSEDSLEERLATYNHLLRYGLFGQPREDA